MQRIAFTDVHYRELDATAACVVVGDFGAATAEAELTVRVSPIAAYEPGAFWKRELPCVLEVLRAAGPLSHIVIDGYVWLDDRKAPGLGAHLFEALGRSTPVLGLAKTTFRGSPMAVQVPRPNSTKPLFLTCAGLDDGEALGLVSRLHGAHRLPTLVKRVDWLARTG